MENRQDVGVWGSNLDPDLKGYSFFAFSWKLPAYNGTLLFAVVFGSFFAYNWGVLLTIGVVFACSWSFLANSGKLYLLRITTDCRQENSTVSKAARTVRVIVRPVIRLFRIFAVRIFRIFHVLCGRLPLTPVFVRNERKDAFSALSAENPTGWPWIGRRPGATDKVGNFLRGGDQNLGERHSCVTRDDGTVMLCALRAATVLSRKCCTEFWSSLNKGGDVTLA